MRHFLATVVAVVMVATACSSAADPTTTSAPTTTTTTTTVAATPSFPVTIEAANGPVTIGERPLNIVSLSPTATETLFAIGAGDQVVAVDDQSNYPAEAPRTDLTGLEPNIEAIAEMEADLVVLMFDAGNVTLDALAAIDIPAIMQPAAVDLEDAFRQIEQLGAATGNTAEAAQLVGEIQAEIEELLSSADAGGMSYYHEVSPDLYSATSATFVGALYAMFGLVNVADPADSDGFGYPQLSAEFLIEADPDLIFLADTRCCAQDAATVSARPGWDTLTAVATGGVVELDDDVASRWGPRIPDFMAAVAAAVGRLVGA